METKPTSTAIAMPKGRVTEIGGQFFVQQQQLDGTWKSMHVAYQHRTSALAGLGRLYEQASTGEEK